MDLLIQLALERKNDSHMKKCLKRHLGQGGKPTPERGKGKGPENPTNANKGAGQGGGNLRAMNEVKPESCTPPLYYCNPVNDKGGPCHAPDCDYRTGCMLQLKRQQHTKNGETVTDQDHFRCTITCGYCGKCRHYEDGCHIKNARVTNTNGRRPNARQPKHPAELPRMGTRVVREEAREVARVETPTCRGAHQRPLFLPLLPMLTPRSAHRRITPPLRGRTQRRADWPGWPSPSWLQGLMSNSRLRSRGAALKRRTWFIGSSQKSGDQHFRVVPDTGATLSIVAWHLLKTFIKNKTVAIRVGDGRTIHSLGGVRKSHCHVFLGGLNPGQAPLKTLLLLPRLT